MQKERAGVVLGSALFGGAIAYVAMAEFSAEDPVQVVTGGAEGRVAHIGFTVERDNQDRLLQY